VATGSHIDSQPSGGKFDGNYGVLAGLEVIRRLEECRIATEHPLEVCVWTNEEGSRFTPVMMGSGVWAGAIGESLALNAVDREGLSVFDELRRIGYAGEVSCGPTHEYPAFAAYFETHIEQGPVLEEAGVPIGEVVGALGQRWFDVMVYGMDAHAGPTPMALRKDAVLASAHLIAQVNAIALAHAPHGRGTVGSIRVEPNSRNVIAGFAQLSVDFRHPDAAGLDAMETALRAEAKALASRAGLAIDLVKVSEFVPCTFDRRCTQAVAESASALGLRSMPIVSGAGHDAVYVARRSPAGMIFIPCKDGISHNETEDALPEHIEAGANVLLGAMLAIAKTR
jgi:N-carbamoyl-L-amino-acid hydrolase